MELQQIIQFITEPDKVLSIDDMEEIIGYSTFWIYTLEIELAEMDFQVDSERYRLLEKHGAVNKAEAMLKLTDIYRERKKKELTLKTLKSYRSNIRKKRDRMISKY